MKKLLFKGLKKLVFLSLNFRDLYWNRFTKDYYTHLLYKKSHNIGTGVRVNGKIKIFNYRGLSIGNNVHFGSDCFINCEGGVSIGDNTHLSRNIAIYSSSHNYEGRALPFDKTLRTKSVRIGKNVWIGMNVSIAPGIEIGEGAIIGMGVVVNKNVASGAIVIQKGLTQVSQRNDDHYRSLESNQQYGAQSGTLLQKKELDNFKIPPGSTKQQVFIVSTGRAGSNSMASILNQHPQISAFHEPHWQFFKLSTEYEYDLIGKEKLEKELKNVYDLSGTIPKDNIYVESDQKLVNFIEILKELYPKSKFIWVIRKPEKFVKSAFTRGWFKESNKFDTKNRLLLDPNYSSRACRVEGFRVNEFTKAQWEGLDPFERCCWYWNYWNSRIEKKLSLLDDHDWIKVDIDQINTNFEKISNFLNIKDFQFTPERKNKAHYTYRKKYDEFVFTEKRKEVLNRFCAQNAKRWLS